ncbi:Histone-lysine N-methyltransferase set9 [Steccherinum ochraceum]|uniref:Histone-lysine N-methyltransferase set9 n=1 Tax=Steccherinum ochraceum TaxID=92696 RepID=A0A4R0RLM8_9APHY|nr:Histone-lysine N-methyltransferase set9 [Steccherinum ochraceum]
MPHVVASASSSSLKPWRPTKIMNMKDLSRDDDFLSHLLVEKLGTGGVPLVVHKMDPNRQLPKSDSDMLLQIVRRLVASKGPAPTAIRHAVDDLLGLHAVRYYTLKYDQKQMNAFATHATRYFELYLPTGSIEIAHTSRYSHRTGKSELCILATRPLVPGQVLSELKGSMADLTEEEDKELKRTDERHADGVAIRRDFSVIHSKQLKKNHLFLGPARFVNHDCDHNVELFREGRYITFRVIKPIAVGEEVTAHYGDGYFGRKNRHCLCESCERKGRGGYGPQTAEDEDFSDSGESSHSHAKSGDKRSPSPSSSSEDDEDEDDGTPANPNERRTRRGVYAVLPDEAETATEGGQIELEAEVEPDGASELTSLPPSRTSAGPLRAGENGLMTPDPESSSRGRSSAPSSRNPSLVTPPLTAENSASSTADSVRSSSRLRGRGAVSGLLEKETAASSSRWSTPVKDKGKGRASASVADMRDLEKDEIESEGRTLRPRASVINVAESAFTKPIEDAPRGLDGRPLPTCKTCAKVLPIISVEDQVVWGMTPGRTGKRGRPKKNADSECPRCLRHYAIYAVSWPDRVPNDGSVAFIAAPRVIKTYRPYDVPAAKVKSEPGPSRSKSTASTPAPDKKSHKRTRGDDSDDDRPSKKKKLLLATRPRGRPPKHKVEMSAKASKLLKPEPVDSGRRSGRARMPSLKLRENDPSSVTLKLRMSPRKNPGGGMLPPSSPLSPEPPTPLLQSISVLEREPPSTPVKQEHGAEEEPKLPTPKSLAVAVQPREANGRFGKKSTTNGRYMRKNFSFGNKRYSKKKAKRKETRDFVKEEDDEEEEGAERKAGSSSGPSAHSLGKRRYEGGGDAEDGSKRRQVYVSDDEDEEEEGVLPRLFLPSKHKVGSALLGKPNPFAFARRKLSSYSPPDGPSRSASASLPTDEDSTPPITPEVDDTEDSILDDVFSDREPSVVSEADEEEEIPRFGFRSMLGFKGPSPFTFARQRWARVGVVGAEPVVEQILKRKSVDLDAAVVDEDLQYPDLDQEDSWEEYSSDEDALDAGGLLYPASDAEDDGASTLEGAQCGSSTESLQATDSTDESERIVERLVAMSQSRPTSSLSSSHSASDGAAALISTPPAPSPLSLDNNSPGMAWKKTVLIPSDDTSYPKKAAFSLLKAFSSPTKLGDADWEPSSDIDF